ncbi:MAG: 2-amino-4-hydroxy-6-hydroxymethyldihydropteridine diphosphokinase [Bryobacterales bacterium]|nr:2-amino-4-hydroxy-6-hydroxymethyldihydropteridine diphosphokinase [Bryobacterales bacterium]
MNEPVCVGLGSNLGDKQQNLAEALRQIGDFATVTAVSSLYRTEPVGFLEQDWFLNAAAVLRTSLEPAACLGALLAVELRMGRVRGARNGPRLIDLDLLLWGDRTLEMPGLQVPHPRLADRHFALLPLAEIAGACIHPQRQLTVLALAEALGVADGVERLHAPDWPPPELRQQLRATRRENRVL